MGSGMAVRIVVGMSTGTEAVKKKLETQLAAAIESEEISVRNENGSPMTADSQVKLIQPQLGGR